MRQSPHTENRAHSQPRRPLQESRPPMTPKATSTRPAPTRSATPAQAIWACPIGFALLLSFNVMLSLMGSRLPPLDAGHALLACQRLLEAATYLLVALLSARLYGMERRRGLVWACALGCCAASLLVGLSLLGLLSGAAWATHVAFSAIKGVAPPLLWLC